MEQEIQDFIAHNPAWQVSGETLVGNWDFADFATLQEIVGKLCDLVEELNHHPTVTFGYKTLQIVTMTHDAGNTITKRDLELAHQVNNLVG